MASMRAETADIHTLQSPVDAAAASGEDLHYSDAYVAMEQMAQIRPEQQFGDTIYEASEPAWHEITRSAFELAQRTHDLRVGIYLVHGAIRTSGIGGFADAIDVLNSWVRNEWETLFPALDPEDADSATERSNVLLGLTDTDRCLQGLRNVVLATGRGIGACTLQHIREARESDRNPEYESRYRLHEIHAIFIADDRASIEALRGDVVRADHALSELVELFIERTGSAPNLTSVQELIGEIFSTINEFVPSVSENEPKTEEDVPMVATADTIMQAKIVETSSPTGAREGVSGTSVPLEINNREDVVGILTAICRYYDKSEPSSPVPLLLRRALKLVKMDFLEIVRNLAPDGLADISRWAESETNDDNQTVTSRNVG